MKLSDIKEPYGPVLWALFILLLFFMLLSAEPTDRPYILVGVLVLNFLVGYCTI